MLDVKAVTFTAQEAANYLGISYWLILELVKRKQIPCTNLGRRKLFRKQALDDWMTEQEEISQVKEEESIENYGVLRRVSE